jgi:AAA+ superfamily predicted ATPase
VNSKSMPGFFSLKHTRIKSPDSGDDEGESATNFISRFLSLKHTRIKGSDTTLQMILDTKDEMIGSDAIESEKKATTNHRESADTKEEFVTVESYTIESEKKATTNHRAADTKEEFVTVEPYDSSLDHVQDELNLLNLQLRLATLKFRNQHLTAESKELSGLVISDQEIEGIFDSFSARKDGEQADSQTFGETRQADAELIGEMKELAYQIRKTQARIDLRKRSSLEKGMHLLLEEISKTLSLSLFEYYTLIICLAPEIDIKYERLYAYLQDDITKKKPSLELCLRLLCSGLYERTMCRDILLNSNLFRFHFLEYLDTQPNMLSRPLRLHDHIVNYILEMNYLESLLGGKQVLYHLKLDRYSLVDYDNVSRFIKDYVTESQSIEISSHNEVKIRLKEYILNILGGYEIKNEGASESSNLQPIILLSGKEGSGRKSSVTSVLHSLNLKNTLLVLDMKTARNILPITGLEKIMEVAIREAIIKNSHMYIDNLSSILTEENEEKNFQTLERILWHIRDLKGKNQGTIIFVAWNTDDLDSSSIIDNFRHHTMFSQFNSLFIEFPSSISYEDEISIWHHYLDVYRNSILQVKSGAASITGAEDDELDVTKIATEMVSKFNFTIGEIERSVAMSVNESQFERGAGGRISKNIAIDSLYRACYLNSNRKLNRVSTRLNRRYLLNDIVLPSERKQQLIDVLNYLKHRNQVFYSWGFAEKLGLNNGLNILFSGESGTGKTMAAQIIANELKLEIYKIDLSMLVSKYIGETEKNIDRIFKEAETCNAVIFFDEADAIFGKRTEIRDSHDRYANIEVSYLLQKLEEHEQIVILASNLKHNIDEAFIRRMQFIIDFPFPGEGERFQIWKRVFPDQFKHLDKDIDWNFLAARFKTSGAMIRNIAITAAFLAASAYSPTLGMKHVVGAVKRELEKNGKPVIPSDFGEYYDMIKDSIAAKQAN